MSHFRYSLSKIPVSVEITSSNHARCPPGPDLAVGGEGWADARTWREPASDRFKPTPTTAVGKGTAKRRLASGRQLRLQPRLRRGAGAGEHPAERVCGREGAAGAEGGAPHAATAALPRHRLGPAALSAESGGGSASPRPARRLCCRSSQWERSLCDHRPARGAGPANGRWGGAGEVRVRGGIWRPVSGARWWVPCGGCYACGRVACPPPFLPGRAAPGPGLPQRRCSAGCVREAFVGRGGPHSGAAFGSPRRRRGFAAPAAGTRRSRLGGSH